MELGGFFQDRRQGRGDVVSQRELFRIRTSPWALIPFPRPPFPATLPFNSLLSGCLPTDRVVRSIKDRGQIYPRIRTGEVGCKVRFGIEVKVGVKVGVIIREVVEVRGQRSNRGRD